MVKDILKLFKGTLIYGLGSAMSQALNVVLLPYLTARLSPNEYGAFALLSVITILLSQLLSLGLGTSISMLYFEKKPVKSKDSIIWTSFIIFLVISSFILIFGSAFKIPMNQLLSEVLNQNAESYIYPCLYIIIFNILLIPFATKLQLEEKQKKLVTLNFISTLLTLSLNIAFVNIFSNKIQGLLLSTAIAKIIIFLMFLFASKVAYKGLLFTNTAIQLLRHGIPLAPSFLAIFVLQQGGPFFLSKFETLKNVGIYSAGYSIGMGMSIFVSALTVAWVPFFLSYKNNKQKFARMFSKIFSYYTIGAGLISLLFYFFGKFLVGILTNVNYHDAVGIIGIFATSQFLVGMFGLLLPAIYYAKKVKRLSFIQITGAVIYIFLTILLIKYLGLRGAAISQVLSYLSMVIILYIWNQRTLQQYLEMKLEWTRIVRFLSFYLVTCTVFIVNDKIVLVDRTTLSTVSIILSLIVAASLLKKEEEKLLQSLIKVGISRRPHILVLYKINYSKVRGTILDHLYSFKKYPNGSVLHYFNVGKKVPRYLSLIKYDGVILHYTLLSQRFTLGEKEWNLLTRDIAKISGYKVAIPQDESDSSEKLVTMFKHNNVKTVFTCFTKEKDFETVYPKSRSGLESYISVLTGYVNESIARNIKNDEFLDFSKRPIDVGFRARKLPYNFGKHGTLKNQLVNTVLPVLNRLKLTSDVKNTDSNFFSSNNVIFGRKWYRFLGSCKAFLGCEGGSSLHDPHGTIRREVLRYCIKNPDATFEEVEKLYFPGKDGNLSLFALSPRHFEAAMTKTLQFLVEGYYNGVLKPGIHYVEIKKDFSNIEEVLLTLKDTKLCEQIIDNAYKDLILSHRYGYDKFSSLIIKHIRKKVIYKKTGILSYIWFTLAGMIFNIRNFYIKCLVLLSDFLIKIIFESTGLYIAVKKRERILKVLRFFHPLY